MMQTLTSRLGDVLASLMARVAEPRSLADEESPSAERMAGDGEGDRLPPRDESYYWAMHAHW